MPQLHFSTQRTLSGMLFLLVLYVCLPANLQLALSQETDKPTIVSTQANIKVGEQRTLQIKFGNTPASTSQLKNIKFSLKITSDNKYLDLSPDGKITGEQPSPAPVELIATYTKEGAKPIPSEPYSLTVVSALLVTFPKTTLVIGDTVTAEVTILRQKGQPYEPLTSDESKSLSFDSSDTNVASVTRQSGEVHAIATGTTDITATVTSSDNGATLVSDPVPISVGEVDKFAKLTAIAHIMDDSTVGELFGASTANGFYVVQLTLKNDLDSHETVLAFADTLAMSVVMEKKYARGRNASTDIPAPPPSQGWTLVTDADFINDFSTTQLAALPAEALADINLFPGSMVLQQGHHLSFKALDKQGKPYTGLTWSSQNQQIAMVDTNGEVTGLSPGMATIVAITSDGRQAAAVVSVIANGQALPHTFLYYPYTFQVVADASFIRFDRLRQASIFNYATALGTIVSFFTAADVLRGTVASNILDKYSNLLIPGLQRLFPSHIDAEASNITRHTMKQVEEIPYGGTTTRLVFFPRRQIKGLLRGYFLRIAAIYLDRAQIDVATITQKQTIQPKAPSAVTTGVKSP